LVFFFNNFFVFVFFCFVLLALIKNE